VFSPPASLPALNAAPVSVLEGPISEAIVILMVIVIVILILMLSVVLIPIVTLTLSLILIPILILDCHWICDGDGDHDYIDRRLPLLFIETWTCACRCSSQMRFDDGMTGNLNDHENHHKVLVKTDLNLSMKNQYIHLSQGEYHYHYHPD
jgi:hypothetical protein